MFRINTLNAVLNLFGAGKNGYQDGNKALGVIPTSLSAATMNAIQEELAAIPEYVGMALDPNNNHQVLAAILQLIEASAGNYSLDTGAANAYVVAMSPAISAYTGNFPFSFKAANGNPAGASTVNFGGGIVPLLNDQAGALGVNDIVAGMIVSGEFSYADNKAYINSMVQSQSDARYAKLAGLSTQNFNVALATLLTHAVNLGQLKSFVPAGKLIMWAGQSAPSGYLQCPTSLSYISATTYSDLAFAIGSTWGGSGSTNAGGFIIGNTYVIQNVGTTNFMAIGAANNNVGTVFTATGVGVGTGAAYAQIALPWFSAGYAPVHGTSGIGVSSTGVVISHGHSITTGGNPLILNVGIANGAAGVAPTYGTGSTAPTVATNTGGAANLAAGVTVMICVKY